MLTSAELLDTCENPDSPLKVSCCSSSLLMNAVALIGSYFIAQLSGAWCWSRADWDESLLELERFPGGGLRENCMVAYRYLLRPFHDGENVYRDLLTCLTPVWLFSLHTLY